MKQRIGYEEVAKDFLSGMNRNEAIVKKSGLDLKLVELIKYRVSQINGCAYCLDMHHKEAIAMGEEELRLHTISAWRECPYYNEGEKAAFEYAEVLTLTSENLVTDELFNRLLNHYSKTEIAYLALAISQINSWNRISKTFGFEPGHYRVGQFADNY